MPDSARAKPHLGTKHEVLMDTLGADGALHDR